jgi:hypothetical protein
MLANLRILQSNVADTTDKLPREILAWRIVLGAFGLFLAICAITAYTAQWYALRSQVDMLAQVEMARGTATLETAGPGEARAIVERLRVEPGARISTDATSQAVLMLTDPHTGDVVASITLFNDTSITLERAGRPRFDFSSEAYSIEVMQHVGRTEIYVGDLNPQSTFDVRTQHGTATIEERGHYLVDEFEDTTAVMVRRGDAQVQAEAGNMTLLDTETIGAALPSTGERAVSLVASHQFDPGYAADWEFYHIDLPQGWQRPVVFKGRDAVLLDRSQGNFTATMNTHGETGLLQGLNVDVSDVESVEVRASFLIEEQSLSTCGEQGSECPMMLRVSYLASDGSPQEFIIGFYSHHIPQRGYPLACATCRTDHQRVNMGTWYTYESGNLMTTLPEDLRPAVITQAQIYASGWAYKVYISELDIVITE